MIGICGGGVGGLTAAIALRDLGRQVVVWEQAPRYGRVGADINLTPNSVHALDGLSGRVGEAIRRDAARPTHRISRTWDTGEETSRLVMGSTAEDKYGSPQLTLHRADLLTALEDPLPQGTVRFDKRVAGFSTDDREVEVQFTDGSTEHVDVLIGADGIHSVVRTELLGPEHPTFTGIVAYRAVVPTAALSGVPNLAAFTKWWGPDPQTQIVTFPLTRGEETFVFATTAQDSWRHESWTMPGSITELREVFQDFHPDARALLDSCDEVLKSALVVRDPLPTWSVGRVTLLGDACHPMTPFMAQGAGMAIEDAVVLARCLAASTDDADELQTYQRLRQPRTSRVQLSSRNNEWLKDSTDADWVYGYRAWDVELDQA